MKKLKIDELSVEIYETRADMGACAARDIKAGFAKLLSVKPYINVIFAAAPSQNEVLYALANDREIEWNRINAYHMDEYIGLDKNAPQGFGNFLRDRLFARVPFNSVHYIDITASDPEAEAERYGRLIAENPADVVVMGIGENGHIAFNDPPVADFNDPKHAKAVKLDEICRRQQVNDGCFAELSQVPTSAITLTVPTLVKAQSIFCIVPSSTKSRAVRETLYGSVDEHCPASILRRCKNATLYLDKDSAALL